jgi:ribosomal protein L37E
MIELKTCAECGVPEYITREHLWLDNGDIVQSRDQGHRMAFFESENIDPLFRNIESIIGVPIEPMVTTTVRRAVRQYVSLLIPDEVKNLIHGKVVGPIPIATAIMDVANMMGQGRQELVGYRYEKDDQDFYTVTVSEPFSLLMFSGTIAGAVEAVLEVERGVTYEEVSENVYKINVFPDSHPARMKERLRMQRYFRWAGNRDLEKCATCGGPRALCDYQWHLDRGVISNKYSGRRMVMIGPQELDVVFKELEKELGDTVPKIIVEAQRRFTASGFFTLWDVKDVEDFGNQLALRGLGNLRDFQISRRGLRMRLDNAVLHLMIVGLLQGAFDAAMSVDSRVDWEFSERGTLEMEVIHAS